MKMMKAMMPKRIHHLCGCQCHIDKSLLLIWALRYHSSNPFNLRTAFCFNLLMGLV